MKDWIIDSLHFLHNATILKVLRKNPPQHYLGFIKPDKVPIIILPGILYNWASLKPLADYLSLKGHPVYIVPKLKNNLHDIPKSSKMVEEVIKQAKLKEAVIVAHSKGGLIAKHLMLYNDPKKIVRGLVAIATPFAGSGLATFIPHKSCKELVVNSEMIQRLEKQTKVNKKIVAIIPETDPVVWYKFGSFLKGARINLKVNRHGHNKLLRDRSIWKLTEVWVNKLVKNKKIESVKTDSIE